MGVPIKSFSVPPLATLHYVHISELFLHRESTHMGKFSKCEYAHSHLRTLLASLFQSATNTIFPVAPPTDTSGENQV